jgi:hypothetical protein
MHSSVLRWASNALGKAIYQLLGKPIIGKTNMIAFAADNGFCG